MLVDLDPPQPDLVDRVDLGLYVPKRWEYDELFRNSPAWYGGDWEWPEFSGPVESRLKNHIAWWNSDHHFYEYGSCDSPEQFKATKTYRGLVQTPWPVLVVFVAVINKANDGGYRFHKNGPYLGALEREGHEYLRDEPNLNEIWQFNVHRRRDPNREPKIT